MDNNTPHQDDPLSSTDEEIDYYAILNLPRDPPPTEAQIRSAYRTLTLSFHPDKQPPELVESARWHFDRIQTAYATLVDPKKRIVYDLLGAEGLRNEWGQGDLKVGVRAMPSGEFRSWFLERMKRKERAVVESLVRSRGSFTLGIDVSDAVTIDEEDGIMYIQMPSPKPSAFSVGFSSRVPMPTLEFLLGEKEGDDDEEEEDKANKPFVDDGDDTELIINAGITGQLGQPYQDATIRLPDGTVEDRQLPLPYVLAAEQFHLGVSAAHAFGGAYGAKGMLAKPLFSFLQDTKIAVNASALPRPSLQTSWVKSVIPIPGTTPFQVQLTAKFDRSLRQALPSLGLNVSRPIGDRTFVFCDWSSGTVLWPLAVHRFFQPLMHIGLQPETMLSIPLQLGSFQIGVVSQATQQAGGLDDDDNDEEDNEEELELTRRKQRKESKAAESWQAVIAASPMGPSMSFAYSRNVFSGQAAYEQVRSEWSSEGRYPLTADNEPRSVRINVDTIVGQDLSLGWHIEGTRKVGEFARMGLGVGIQGVQGLVMTVSWSRLGQKIRLPISLIPFEAANADIAALAVICPWLAYCALEFGVIRPRDRKKQRRVIARRQKQLKKLMPKKRAKSQKAIELMAEQVQRRQAREAEQNGLVITRAEYGHYPSKKDKDGVREPQVTDVSIPVAALVDHGQLAIPKDMVKSHILGFHDPAPLLPKTLKIWYIYHGKEHYTEANDAEGIACPMRPHLLS
ncbi:hypothetical protein BO94DRAFT_83710 [Aspergillus sclerotioniger CBS 115572]|uniref:J domain-containing protein n=1 Tax=Aspergillus sclerotioniger CBS 115572 TaxID=1450535 RepID=A0A317WL83_9EURO|nr:hypothetical protein BO94DRAFT_83710 [Aspergillus sclerotioniger CBS 115572]PWY86471.1 hypothetical protein BO94DRAFT_83710 [Aspergillus sclerotioniger CBS 115572]